MKWKANTSGPVGVEDLHLGRWKVGGYFFNPLQPRGTTTPWRAVCSLPGIKPVLGDFETDTEAQARVERAVRHWVDCGGLELTDDNPGST
jgi:hypothetical protein